MNSVTNKTRLPKKQKTKKKQNYKRGNNTNKIKELYLENKMNQTEK